MRAFAKDHPVFQVVFSLLLAALLYATMREVVAHAARGAVPATRAPQVAPAQILDDPHAALADTDLGPGQAEPAVAAHPIR